jgi:transposase-like protein/IS1 family transposase
MKIACPFCGSENLKVHQKNGHAYSTMFRCLACDRFFSERRFTGYSGLKLPPEKIVQIVNCLMEGISVRATARLLDVEKKTVLRVMLHAARLCQRVKEAKLRRLRPRYVQADELWAFVNTKEKHLRPSAPAEWGDAYTWIAIDAETKLVVSYHVGKRDRVSAFEFITDLGQRVVGQFRFQITTDGLHSYVPAIEERFGADVDYAQLIKIYGSPDANQGPDWYRPGRVLEVVPVPVSSDPDDAHISTSHVERHNLTIRMQLRRFTRLTNGFSKKLANLKAAVDLYVTWYNFCRVHQTLRVTPAMEAGLTDHVWDIGELLNAGASS